MNLTALCQKRRLVFDGGTGSSLMAAGLKPGEMPEKWNILRPEEIVGLHTRYIEAGADIIKTNTFGAYSFKLGEEQGRIVSAALDCAERAVTACGKDTLIALDVGPLGKLLEPFGDLSFDGAVSYFKELITLGKDRADLILIETMSDLYEIKAAVLAAKEVASLPIIVTVALDQRGRILTGADVETIVTTLEGLGVAALGVNCGFGPHTLAPFVKTITEIASVPVVCNPNAGLPEMVGGRAVYSITPENYAREMEAILSLDVAIVGGCCGTTPDHIAAIAEKVKASIAKVAPKNRAAVTGYMKTVTFCDGCVFIGDKLNAMKNEALSDGDPDTLLDEAMEQMAYGVQLAEVLATAESLSLCEMLQGLQESLGTPFMLVGDGLDDAWRHYNGKPLVYAASEDCAHIFDLMQAYGGTAVFAVNDPDAAEAIFTAANAQGFGKCDFMIAPIGCDREAFAKLNADGFMTALVLSSAPREMWEDLADLADIVIGDATDGDADVFLT